MNESERDQLLIETREDVAVIKNQMLVITDHETRIRGLERFRYAFPSVALLALSVAGGGLAYSLFS